LRSHHRSGVRGPKVKAETSAKGADPLLKSELDLASKPPRCRSFAAARFKTHVTSSAFSSSRRSEKMMLVEIIVGKNTGDVALATRSTMFA